jgi:hypothetical protein
MFGIAVVYGLEERRVGVRVPVGARIFSCLRRPDRLWGPPSLVSIGYRGQSGRGVKVTTHLQLVPMSRIRGSIHPLPNTPSWRISQLVKHRDNFYIYHICKNDSKGSSVRKREMFSALIVQMIVDERETANVSTRNVIAGPLAKSPQPIAPHF